MSVWRDSYAQRDGFLKSLILANVAVTGLWLTAQMKSGKSSRPLEIMEDNFTVSSRGVFKERRYYTLVTSFFSHKSVSHLVNNMYTLWALGPAVIHTIGTANFALLYMGGGVISSLAQLYWPYIIPQSWPAYIKYNSGNSLGASGAISSLAMWVSFRWPTHIFRLYGVMELPGAVVGALTVAMDMTGLYDGGSNIGHMAHLAGAAFGALYFVSSRIMGSRR